MGEKMLPLQIRENFIKNRIDSFSFLTLREGFQDFHFPIFAGNKSSGAVCVACQVIRNFRRQLIFDIAGESPGCHLCIAFPIAAVLFALFAHTDRVFIEIRFYTANLRRFLRLHPGQHTLENLQPVTLTLGDHPPGNRLFKSA